MTNMVYFTTEGKDIYVDTDSVITIEPKPLGGCRLTLDNKFVIDIDQDVEEFIDGGQNG